MDNNILTFDIENQNYVLRQENVQQNYSWIYCNYVH